jgi:cytochrome b involved in lipid metabolism
MPDDEVPDDLVGIHGVCYDLSEWEHPGGAVWLDVVRGTDATALFEMHHVRVAAR